MACTAGVLTCTGSAAAPILPPCCHCTTLQFKALQQVCTESAHDVIIGGLRFMRGRRQLLLLLLLLKVRTTAL